MANLNNNVAPKWASNEQYKAGRDYVLINNKLYRCKESHKSTTFSADASKWEEKELTSLVGGVVYGLNCDYIADPYDENETYHQTENQFCMYDDHLFKCLQNDTTGPWDPERWERAYLADIAGENSNLAKELEYVGSTVIGPNSSATFTVKKNKFSSIIVTGFAVGATTYIQNLNPDRWYIMGWTGNHYGEGEGTHAFISIDGNSITISNAENLFAGGGTYNCTVYVFAI